MHRQCDFGKGKFDVQVQTAAALRYSGQEVLRNAGL